jgi:subtilisin family serine protease
MEGMKVKILTFHKRVVFPNVIKEIKGRVEMAETTSMCTHVMISPACAFQYPARYPHVIGIGALDKQGKLANFSARGKGINMSAPHISGLLALRLAAKK